VTNESDGYYADYATNPVQLLGRCLTEGFAYQGDPSPFRDGVIRGEPSRSLPPTAFVAFSQNHDQIGNRAFGERISQLAEPAALRAITEILLLAPSPPLLFMGQEFAAAEPFLFFCQFGPDLANLVTEGRRREFARFAAFNTPEAQARIPDPNDPTTFEHSRLNWDSLTEPSHHEWLTLHQHLLGLRQQEIVPRLNNIEGDCGNFDLINERGLIAHWLLGDSSRLALLANLGNDSLTDITIPEGQVLYASAKEVQTHLEDNVLPSWAVVWFLHKE
jgi:1,4-alpha-glucan branching enzyme